MTFAVMEKGKAMSDKVKKTGQVVVNMTVDEDALKRMAVKIIEENDLIKVVRCKDCKYLKPFTSQYLTGQFCECPCSFGGQGIKKPDDYCSYGERRDDKEYNNSILNARKGEE